MTKKMNQSIICSAIIFLYLLLTAATAVELVAEPSGCNRTCGDIIVPYPFGFGNSSKSFKDSTFQLVCDESTLLFSNIPFVNIFLENGTAVVDLFIAFNCRGPPVNNFNPRVDFVGSPFMFSSTANMFTSIGCNTVAQISDGGEEAGNFVSGCLSLCRPNTTIRDLDFLTHSRIHCSGVGCCQTPIPKGLENLNISLRPYTDSYPPDNNTCSYGFLSSVKFTLKESPERYNTSADKTPTASTRPMVKAMVIVACARQGLKATPTLEWVVQTLTSAYIETEIHSHCKGSCKNMIGNYTCGCSFGYLGDGKIGCNMKTVTKVFLVIGALFVLLTSVLISLWLYEKKIQRSNQKRNGGDLMDKLSVKIFKQSQLEKATNNFDSRQLLGEGGNGSVYKGSLENMVEIAVKKSKQVDKDQIEQFLNEADIVSKINHKNVVKLLGLCLDSKVPMLVYEFVANGTLFQHLYQNKSRLLDSWRNCLRVAAETARALDYMHSQADPLIIHRDVKTANILLDAKNIAKVADFGASKLIRMDRKIAPTKGQGTLGYLDPEYLQTGDLTTMSDVYAFGVVLMELLSKQKPITYRESGEVVSLVRVFTSAIENNDFEVLRVAAVTEQETKEVHLVARLAVRCVAMQSKYRPTMTEVTEVLNGLSKEYSSFPVEENGEETVNLLDDQDILTTSMTFEIEHSGNV